MWLIRAAFVVCCKVAGVYASPCDTDRKSTSVNVMYLMVFHVLSNFSSDKNLYRFVGEVLV
jgi:hypothetical protein